MREPYRLAAATTLIALSAAVYSAGQDSPMAQPQIDQPAPIGPPQYATVTVFDSRAVQGILGKEVRSAHDENMAGRQCHRGSNWTGQGGRYRIEWFRSSGRWGWGSRP
jgi:hypothetical protein